MLAASRGCGSLSSLPIQVFLGCAKIPRNEFFPASRRKNKRKTFGISHPLLATTELIPVGSSQVSRIAAGGKLSTFPGFLNSVNSRDFQTQHIPGIFKLNTFLGFLNSAHSRDFFQICHFFLPSQDAAPKVLPTNFGNGFSDGRRIHKLFQRNQPELGRVPVSLKSGSSCRTPWEVWDNFIPGLQHPSHGAAGGGNGSSRRIHRMGQGSSSRIQRILRDFCILLLPGSPSQLRGREEG